MYRTTKKHRPDPLTNGSEAWHKRQAIHHHNELFGRAHLARSAAKAVIGASTTTDESKMIALEMGRQATLLIRSLRTRRDQTKS